MKWRIALWILRIAVIAAVLYGVWCGAAYFLGKHYFRRGMVDFARDPVASMQRFEVAAKLQPKNARYQAAFGRASMKAGRFPQAAKSLQKAANLRPEDFGIWHDLGQAYLKANAPAESVRAYKRALEIRPNAELAMVGLAEAATKAGDAAAALDPLRLLWKRSPKDVGLAGRLASALVQQGKADEALAVCAKARATALPATPEDLNGDEGPTEVGQAWCGVLAAEGDAHRAKGHWADAIVAYQRCLLIDSAGTSALDGLAQLPPQVGRRIATDLLAHSPSISPDGKRVAFFADGLYTADLDSGEATRVAAEGVRGCGNPPAWSPDGRRLCYTTDGRLRVVNVDGTGDRGLVREAAPLPQLAKLRIKAQPSSADSQGRPSWAPNGKRIAFSLGLEGTAGVNLTCVVNVQTGKASSVHNTKGALPKLGAGGFTPAWSPDGRVLCGPLLYRPDRQALGLTFWSADGVVKRQVDPPHEGVPLAGAQSPVLEASWSPDARHLAALLSMADARGRTVLALLPAAEGKTGRIVAKDVIAFRWVDATHVWLLQRTGTTYVDRNLRELTADLQGKLTLGKEGFPLLTCGRGQFDLTQDRRRTVVQNQGADSGTAQVKGLWVFDLGKLRPRPS